MPNFKQSSHPRRDALIALGASLPLVVTAGLFAGWFVGAVPPYPHLRNLKLCSPPRAYNFSDSLSWHLWVTICFDTPDTPSQVTAWYARWGWAGQTVPSDKFGMVPIGRLDLGAGARITAKRQVLATDTSVSIRTEYDLYSTLCPLQTWRYLADSWSVVEIGSLLKTMLKVMVVDCLR